MIPYLQNPRKGKTFPQKEVQWLPRAGMETDHKRVQGNICVDSEVLHLDRGGYITINIYQNPSNSFLKMSEVYCV